MVFMLMMGCLNCQKLLVFEFELFDYLILLVMK